MKTSFFEEIPTEIVIIICVIIFVGSFFFFMLKKDPKNSPTYLQEMELKISQILPGMERTKVIKLIGKPDDLDKNSENSGELWRYKLVNERTVPVVGKFSSRFGPSRSAKAQHDSEYNDLVREHPDFLVLMENNQVKQVKRDEIQI